MSWIDAETLCNVASDARAGRKIDAIRSLRQATNAPLKDAAALVHALADSQAVAAPTTREDGLGALDAPLRHRLLFLLATGRRAEAVRTLMAATGEGAAQARDRLSVERAAGWQPALGRAELKAVIAAAETGGNEAAAKAWVDLTGTDDAVATEIVEALAVRPAPPRPPALPDATATRALVAAVESGLIDGTRAALKREADPNAPLGAGDVLGAAAARGDLTVMDLLLAHGAWVTGQSGQATPLERAVDAGQDEAAALLVRRGAAANRAADPILSRLLQREESPATDLLDLLLSQGVSADTQHLVLAIDRGHEQATHCLLSAAVDPNGRVDDHRTPLMAAAERGCPALVEALLDRGALMNTPGPRGDTALHFAVVADDDGRTASILVERGANIRARNNQHKTPLRHAREIGRTELAQRLEQAALAAGPQWMRDARAQRIGRLTLYYHKADGLAFNPNDIERCVLVGGDYDGAWPMTAEQALDVLHRRPHPPQADALIPFLERIANGEDFALSALIDACNPRIERG